ncbi:MAG: methyltransferase domain-containing protein [Gemmatimonadaceae bacterium]
MIDENLAALKTSLERRFRVVNTTLEMAGRAVSILHPASAEELISEVDFDRDERLPYWAELWPSSRILGEHMLGLQGNGRSLLDLGCGSGLVTVCAALAGFDVVASDYYDDAVRFARLNASKNGGRKVRGLSLDWRHIPTDLHRFDVVVASDVLYEQPYGALIAGAIGATLAPSGIALVADPGRVARENFLVALPAVGLELRSQIAMPYADGEVRQTITIFELAHAQ